MKVRTKDGSYSESFKKFIVEKVTLGKITKAAANRKYGIKSHSAILDWSRKFTTIETKDSSKKTSRK